MNVKALLGVGCNVSFRTLFSDIAFDLTRAVHSDRYMYAVVSAELHLLTLNCSPGLEDMAVTPAIVLAKLQGLNISAEVIDHPAVFTVEVARKF